MREMGMRRMIISLFLLSGIIAFGVIGYHKVENMSIIDSLYMTIITISTVGFGEVKPLSVEGRIITMIIIGTWITIGAYTIGNLFRVLVEGELSKTFGRKKLEKQISQLKNHYIICGYGRIGKLICRELQNNDIDFVAIDNDPDAVEQMDKDKLLFIPKDATLEDVLMSAGLMQAKGIVTALRSDADNVFISLTARELRPDIYILARASDESSLLKLKRAGANRVDLPYAIGGKRMAQALVKPAVGDFLDFAVMEMDKNLGLGMEEVLIRENSNLVGKNLIQSNVRQDYGIIIVAIKKHTGEMTFNPVSTEVLYANDTLVILGKKEDLYRMKKKISS